jgi:hypothetical protein
VYALLEGTAPNRRLTSEWMGVPLAGGAGDGTFEMTLFETSDRIVMQYLDVVFGTGSDNGATAVVGVDNATGANGTPFSCFSPSVANGSAIGWRRFASPTAIFSDDAESGPAGFTATGLWHREQESASACSPASRSGDWSWYYGQSSSCDYETPGLANSRTLTTQLIEGLPQDARLSFWQRRQTEGLAAYDISRVDVQADGGGFAPVMPFADESNAWRHTEDFVPPFPELGRFSSLDLSDHTGRDVELRFSFATVDSQFNTFLGWMVDDVAIHACPVFAPGGAEAAAAEARATAHPPLICETKDSRLDAVGSYCAACPVPLTYQWSEDGVPIGGATGVTYDVAPGHAPGTFDFTVEIGCPASPACGATSAPAEVVVVARPEVVGPTLMLTTDGVSLTFHWVDVAGTTDYLVLSDANPSVPLATEVGASPSGTSGLTTAMPPGDLVFFQVVGRNPACGAGPQG